MTVRELVLRHPGGTTPVVVGQGALEAAHERLAAWVSGRAVFVLSTPRVFELHGRALALLEGGAARCETLLVEDGEGAKTPEVASRLWRQILTRGGKRDSRLLTFGGGSVGDLGGFVAGCFLRGIAFAHLPTTLLSQVDASIGGKTGVDLPEGKNTVGLFRHPDLVVSETGFLRTLAREEVRSGLVEAIKMAFLLDPALFARIEDDLDALLDGDPRRLAPIVAGGAAAKIGIVEADPEEAGLRRLLNFGHTLGHAIESTLAYEGLRHGEAVAYGMLFALRLAGPRGLPRRDGERLRGVLERLALPPLPPLDPADLLGAMARDKKALESGLAWVLPVALGRGEAVPGIPPEVVAGELADFVSQPWGPGPTP